jgi:hypothetical protein
MIRRATALSACVASVAGHGAMVTPRSRNSVEWLVNVNTQRCSNITGDTCNNGQASFWYSQGARRPTVAEDLALHSIYSEIHPPPFHFPL